MKKVTLILAVISSLFTMSVMATPYVQPITVEIDKTAIKAKIERSIERSLERELAELEQQIQNDKLMPKLSKK